MKLKIKIRKSSSLQMPQRSLAPLKRAVIFSALCSSMIFLNACTPVALVVTPTYPQSYALDGVKEINPSITDGDDASSLLQTQYSVSTQSRLLLRYEELLDKADQVSRASGNTVNIDLNATTAAAAQSAQPVLSLCPLTRNWMMLATWSMAYPMGSSGDWQTLGGDYDVADCITPTVSGTDLDFDVTAWFLNYVSGRSLNNGLILISTQTTPIVIVGDADVTNGPKIRWIQ
jgi:hypothetical protein